MGIVALRRVCFRCFPPWAVGLLVFIFSASRVSGVENRTIAAGSWHSTSTWSEGYVPVAGQPVLVRHALTLTNATVHIGSCVVSNSRINFTGWSTKLWVQTNLTLINSGKLGLPGPFTTSGTSNRIWVVCSNLTLMSGTEIIATTGGYQRAYGPGAGTGASHGNQRPGYAFGAAYGSLEAPTQPGSGGAQATSGRGGGAVRIEASGTVTVHGAIRANGGGRTGIHDHGGSGGSIYLTCNRFDGSNSGRLEANGEATTHGGYSGGGGRIAVIYNPSVQAGYNPDVRFQARAGSASTTYNPFRQENWHGTVYFPDTTFLSQNIGSGQFTYLYFHANNFTNWTVSNLVISNSTIGFGTNGFHLKVLGNCTLGDNGTLDIPAGGRLDVGGNLDFTFRSKLYLRSGITNGTGQDYGCRLSVTGDVTIGRESWLYPWSHGTDGGSPLIRLRHLTIESDGGIDAKGIGYFPGKGPGKGSQYYGGGGHGGKGGGPAGGPVNGVTNAPIRPGSGGGNSTISGEGGGLIRIESRGTITAHGTIRADGNNGPDVHGAGAAGGSVFIQCRTFEGDTNGQLRVRGGNGSYSGTGGGGGRIAVWHGSPIPASLQAAVISNLPIPYLVYTNSVSNYLGTVTYIGGTPGHQTTYGGNTGTVRFIYYNPPQQAPVISNSTPTNVQSTTAYFNGFLQTTGWQAAAVSVYWGDTDGGAPTSGLWQFTNTWPAGTWTSGSYPTYQASGLTANRLYYYRFYATNSYGPTWAPASQPVLTGDVWVETPDPAADENGPDNGTFRIRRAVATTNVSIRIDYAILGTATLNTDYTLNPEGTSVLLPESVSETNIVVLPVWDGLSEGNETVVLRIENGGYIKAAPVSNTVTIADAVIVPGNNNTIAAGNWTNPAIWSLSRPPAQGDQLLIRHAVTLTNSTVPLTSCIVSNGATLTLRRWNTALQATNITIRSTGKITTGTTFTERDMSNRVYLVCSNLTVESGGLIDQTQCGYAGENGPGRGTGPSHGGPGGGYTYGPVYGSLTAPETPGSGGNVKINGPTPGQGGGVVRIQASGIVTIHGTIRANGAGRPGGSHDNGGAGGAIYITCSRLAGSATGLIQANGENAGLGGMAGGGGRVAIIYDPVAQAGLNPGVRLSATGGTHSTRRLAASLDGTLYLPDSTFLSETLSGNLFLGCRLFIPGFTNWAVGSLTINGCNLTFGYPGFRLTVTNDLWISGSGTRLGLLSNSTLSCRNLIVSNSASLFIWSGPTNPSNPNHGALITVRQRLTTHGTSWIHNRSDLATGGSPLWRVGHVTIGTGGGFDALGYGFGLGMGPGRGSGGTVAAASHGGLGGGAGAGPLYGVSNAPVQPGSGGGSPEGGEGGGAIRIEASGNITLDGTLKASADHASGTHYDGGSGGSIFIQCALFTGTGTGLMQANGGNGNNSGGAGGGGGRIAVIRGGDTYAGNTTVDGGIGSTANGQPGTIYWKIAGQGTLFLLR